MLKKVYAEALTTINAAKYCILIVFIVYFGACAAGWFYHDDLSFFKEPVNQLIEGFKDRNTVTFISKLMMRNLIAAYLTTCLISLWGLIPAVATTVNGLLLGWIIANASGMSPSMLLVLLIPHGILELPAAFIGWGVGIWKGFGYRFTSQTTNYQGRFIKANIVYFTVILPLLLIAAIIEGRYHIYKEFF